MFISTSKADSNAGLGFWCFLFVCKPIKFTNKPETKKPNGNCFKSKHVINVFTNVSKQNVQCATIIINIVSENNNKRSVCLACRVLTRNCALVEF